MKVIELFSGIPYTRLEVTFDLPWFLPMVLLSVSVICGCARGGFEVVSVAQGDGTARGDGTAHDSAFDVHGDGTAYDSAFDAHSPATPVFENASSGSVDSASVTFSHTVNPGTDRLLLVGALIAAKAYTTSSVTYAGMALTQIDKEVEADTPGEDCNSTMWYLVNPPIGTSSVVSNLEASTRPMAVWAMSFSGVDQAAPIGDRNSAVGLTLATTASVPVASAADELVVDSFCMAISPPGRVVAGEGQTERIRQDAPSGELRAVGSTRVGSASASMLWGFDSAYYTLHAVALRPRSGG